MKINKIFGAAASLLMLAGTFAACESELEHYTVSAPTATTVTSDNSSVDVTEENTGDVLLTFSYESLGSMSDGDVSTNQGAYVLQASSSSSFENFVTKVGSNATGKQSIKLTGEELNVMASKLGIAGGEYSDIYFRIATLYNENNYQDAKYSDPITVSVKPLKIFMHYLMLSFKSDAKEDAVDSLYSPKEDGIYKGFVKVASWWNWCAYDALGTRYATDEKDGWKFAHMYNTEVDGSNLWFPGIGGCYYVTANTNDGAIEYTYIPSLTVSGGAEGSLSLAQEVCHWTGVITTTADNQNITISGKTYTFNQATGQGEAIDDGIPTEGNISFAGADGVLTVGDGSISVPKAGQYKIILDLNNSSKLTYKLEDMSNVKLYPTAMTANIGGQQAEMDVEMSGVLATGVYKVFVKVASAGEMTFTDGAGAVQEVKANIEAPGYYDIALNLEAGTVTALPYGSTLTVSGGNWTGELKMNENGKYVGFLTVGEGWDIILTDENGQSYGTYKSWDQYTFGIQENGYDHFWLEPKGNAFIEIDPANHSWTYAYENALLVISKQATIGATGSGIRTILYYDEVTGTYTGSYDNSADESGTNWNYYLQGVNSTKDGFSYYGCVEWDNTQLEEREFADASDAHSLWVDPAKKYTMSVDLANKTIVYDELVVPTKLVVYDSEKTNVVVELEAKGDGVFEGVLPAGDGWINYYIKGTADGSDKELWYGSDANWTKDDNGWANLMALNGGNLYADVTGQSLKITVNINDNSIVYAIAE
jgi:hypothetical protein